MNKNQQSMCDICYHKEGCDKTVLDAIFCKGNQQNFNLTKILRVLEEIKENVKK